MQITDRKKYMEWTEKSSSCPRYQVYWTDIIIWIEQTHVKERDSDYYKQVHNIFQGHFIVTPLLQHILVNFLWHYFWHVKPRR